MNWRPVDQLFEPESPGLYLVTTQHDDGPQLEFASWDGGAWELRQHRSSPLRKGVIVAWTELPKPWEPLPKPWEPKPWEPKPWELEPEVVTLDIQSVRHKAHKE